ncbi:MAG: alanine--tRNA ligase [Elusimicrobia bacterium]|nr:alanine--tRNA ligase [Elusimicrobiota bacterium]
MDDNKTSSQLRKDFLGFFERRKHVVRPSAPLIPPGDPSLMFSSAGMVQFKPYFLGQRRDVTRAATCQRCFRTTDIERVGSTLRHLTFFEMLGNFSFGDYFKAEAIAWAWELLTKEMGIDAARLHPTVFKDDAEAEELWRKQGPKNPVLRLGEDTNFWTVGPTGPCGPCSEIYFDRGAEFSCGGPSCAPGCDCDRYIEIWNLVFMQFDRRADGGLAPLPRRNIDTGMGLERLAFVTQGKRSPFETDLFAPIVSRAARLLKTPPGARPETDLAFRVIADHARAAVMLMSEGLIPSNVERGYVLRRLIRRAARYGQLLGSREPFLHELVEPVIDVFRPGHPELAAARDIVSAGLKMEEERFLQTLDAGERELKAILKSAPAVLPGDQAFKLHDTFGFPLELTREICAQRGVAVDEAGFRQAKTQAAETARASWKGSGERAVASRLPAGLKTSFDYEALELVCEITAAQGELLVLARTPFYAEGGGQIGDSGELFSEDGKTLVAEVLDTQKHGALTVHMLDRALGGPGAPGPGARVLARVDERRRRRVAAHHSATHLLNQALRQVLGPHVRQAGSFVDDERLRFDFTHPKALSPDELGRVEGIVKEQIRKALAVDTREMPPAEAREAGAVTLLGEDYGDRARAVLIGPEGWRNPRERFSLELCGGTHVSNTRDILDFKIVKEASASAGIRRIEAVAGPALTAYLERRDEARKRLLARLVERQDALLGEIRGLGGKAEPAPEREESSLRANVKRLENDLRGLKSRSLSGATRGRRVLEVKGLKLMVQRLEGADPKSLRGLSDKLKAELGSGAVFLAAPREGKLSFVLTATPDLAGRLDAGASARKFAAARGGSAGGRADFAQGGIPDADWEALVAGLTGSL